MNKSLIPASLIFILLMLSVVPMAIALSIEQKVTMKTWERGCIRECRIKRYQQCNMVRLRFEKLEHYLILRDSALSSNRTVSPLVKRNINRYSKMIQNVCPEATQENLPILRKPHLSAAEKTK